MITIVHGGQTGVDRGAHDAASDNLWRIAGFMPQDGRDEDGLIPRYVATFLQPCAKSGYGSRTEANVKIAHALLVVVPDAADPRATPGTRKTWELAAKCRVRREAVAPDASVYDLASWIRNMLDFHLSRGPTKAEPFRLMVAGPRASKWPQGRIETAGLLRRVKLEMDAIKNGTSAEFNRRMPRKAQP